MIRELATEIGTELETHDQAGGFQRSAGNPPRNMIVSSQPREAVIDTIIELLPIIAKCAAAFAQSGRANENSSPQDIITDNFDPNTGTYDRHFVEQIRSQTRRANREAHQKRGRLNSPLSNAEADAITIATLEKIRLATPEQFAAGFHEAITGEVPPAPEPIDFHVEGTESFADGPGEFTGNVVSGAKIDTHSDGAESTTQPSGDAGQAATSESGQPATQNPPATESSATPPNPPAV